jgi:hypothetical protein
MNYYKAFGIGGFLAIAACIAAPARADGGFVCTPAAIHAKTQYTLGVWSWLNSSASDSASGNLMRAKLEKIWDGNGDCSGDADTGNLPRSAQVDLLTTHFYGDMMAVAFNIGAKTFKPARLHMNDWLEADKLIRGNPEGLGDQLVADDTRNRVQMMGFNTKLAKLGYP